MNILLFIRDKILKPTGNYLLDYIKSKRVGYYFALVTSILLIIFGFWYGAYYDKTKYYSLALILLPVLVGFAYIGISFYPPLEGLGTLVLCFGSAGTVCLFALKTNGYLSEVFYAGFTPAAWAALDKVYLTLFIFVVLTLIFSIVAVFTKKNVVVDKEVTVHEE